MFRRSWVQISAPFLDGHFSNLYVVRIVCLKRRKINEKEACVGSLKRSFE